MPKLTDGEATYVTYHQSLCLLYNPRINDQLPTQLRRVMRVGRRRFAATQSQGHVRNASNARPRAISPPSA